jgi:hypothetical protein
MIRCCSRDKREEIALPHAARIAPTSTSKRTWTKPVVRKLSPAEALVKLMQADQPAGRTVEQIDLLSRSLPGAG